MPETQGSDSLPGILAEIVATKAGEVARLEPKGAQIRDAASRAPAPRDFRKALARPGTVSLIAECKRRSPGAGAIRDGFAPSTLAAAYQAGGAAALSVLTDARYFGGSADDLRSARGATSLPVLRKDFTLAPVQVHEARAMGADAVLLIVRILSDEVLTELLSEITELGMAALVEVHDRRDLDRALAVGASIVGINNRDLATFTTDLETTLRLLDAIPDDVVVVSESGIRTAADVQRLGSVGVDAILVGESLLRSSDPGVAAGGLSRVPMRPRTPTPETTG